MTGRPTYETDAYRTHLDAEVLAEGSDDRGPWVVLSDTVLYPEGGGQPRDHGQVSGIRVLDLVRTDDGLRHYLEGPPPEPMVGTSVPVSLDQERRLDHMVQHTAQHLLTALADRLHGRATTSFHLGPDRCDIEIEGSPPDDRRVAELEEAAVAAIREHRAVVAQWISREDYDARSDIRTRGLPDHHTGDVRLIEIEGIDLTACGGTHVAHTGELETIKVLSTEAMRGGTRIHWVAGPRVRRRLDEHEARASALRTSLGVATEEIAGAVSLRLDQLKDAQRRVRTLESDLAAREIERLLLGDEPVVTSHFEDRDAGFLRELAARFSQDGAGRAALFTSTDQGQTFFVVATGPEARAAADVLGPAVAEALGGRGGGRGSVFQGKAPGTGQIESAEIALREALGT